MRALILLVGICSLIKGGYAQSISLTGGPWTIPNFSVQQPAEAGSDYASSNKESASGHTLIRIFNGGILLSSFTVKARISGLPAGLGMSVRRTGTGSGLNLLGLNLSIVNLGVYYTGAGVPMNQYLALTGVDQPFFSFNSLLDLSLLSLGGIRDIPIQYRLEGLSVLLPVNTYHITITYTVSN